MAFPGCLSRVRPALLMAAALSMAFCSCKRDENAGGPAPRPAPVLAAKVVKRPMPVRLSTMGIVAAKASVVIRAEVNGTLTTVHFRKGQEVRKGDKLFTIDPRPFEAALARAEATLGKARVELDNARKNAQRDAELLRKGVAAESERDKSQTDAEAMAAEVRADEAAVASARLDLEDCTILSPIDGRTGNLLVTEGNLVKANDTTLLTIHQMRPIEVVFAVSQNDWVQARKYVGKAPVKVSAEVPEDPQVETGEVTFVDNAVDKATGTLQLAATFANEQERLCPGQFVNVSILWETQEALTAPQEAIQTGRDGKYVFVITGDNKAAIRAVTAGASDGQYIAVQGLQEGETVVTDGQLRLTPGCSVEITTPQKLKVLTGGSSASNPATTSAPAEPVTAPSQGTKG